MSGVGFYWNDNTVARAKTLWTDGKSATEIAAELGTTRNTIIGKMNRMGLFKKERSVVAAPTDTVQALTAPEIVPRAKAPSKPRVLGSMTAFLAEAQVMPDVPDQRRNVVSHTPLAPTLIEPTPNLTGEGTPFLDVAGRTGFCKYPLWTYDDQPIEEKHVCGHKPLVGTSWCAHHMKRIKDPRATKPVAPPRGSAGRN